MSVYVVVFETSTNAFLRPVPAVRVQATAVVGGGLALQELDEHLEVGDLRLELADEVALHLERVQQLPDGRVHLGDHLRLAQLHDLLRHVEVQAVPQLLCAFNDCSELRVRIRA